LAYGFADLAPQSLALIPAYMDRWMMGDRCGEVIRCRFGEVDGREVELWTVRLDKSGKTVVVYANDCRVI
jgi:integrase